MLEKDCFSNIFWYNIIATKGEIKMNDLKNINIDGLKQIGKGANGTIYQLDDDKIIKVYNPITNPLEKIKREKNAAKNAFIHGVPCAISYDIVSVDNKYGMIYEWINSSTLGQYITNHPDKLEEYAKRMANLLKKLHTTSFEDNVLPDGRDNLHAWVNVAENSNYYSKDTIQKLRNLVNNIPYENTFIHGDFHPGNIMVYKDELLLIDMSDASVGNPIIDLLGSYQIMKLVSQRNGGAERYTGMSSENLLKLWNTFIQEYTGINNKDELNEYEEILKFYALIRSIPGVTFSELVPKEILPIIVNKIETDFLSRYELLNMKQLKRNYLK